MLIFHFKVSFFPILRWYSLNHFLFCQDFRGTINIILSIPCFVGSHFIYLYSKHTANCPSVFCSQALVHVYTVGTHLISGTLPPKPVLTITLWFQKIRIRCSSQEDVCYSKSMPPGKLHEQQPFWAAISGKHLRLWMIEQMRMKKMSMIDRMVIPKSKHILNSSLVYFLLAETFLTLGKRD